MCRSCGVHCPKQRVDKCLWIANLTSVLAHSEQIGSKFWVYAILYMNTHLRGEREQSTRYPMCITRKMCKVCMLVFVVCLLHPASPLGLHTHQRRSNMLCAFSGWVPPEGYVRRRLRQGADGAPPAPASDALKTRQAPRTPFRPWRQQAQTRKVLNTPTVVAVASLIQDTEHAKRQLQQEVRVQRLEIASLRTHMSALELQAELRDFWRKEFKEVRYIGNDTFVVAYTVRL